MKFSCVYVISRVHCAQGCVYILLTLFLYSSVVKCPAWVPRTQLSQTFTFFQLTDPKVYMCQE